MTTLENLTDYGLNLTIKDINNNVVDLSSFDPSHSYCYIVSNDNSVKVNMSITVTEPTSGNINISLSGTAVGSNNITENILSLDNKKIYRIVLKVKTDTETIHSIIDNVVIKG